MAQLALYRRYRPRTFTKVLGQDVVTRTLQNQVKTGRITHAYLFCGTRGTGKTSTAKILARAVNCLFPAEGNPCGVCEVCRMSDAALSSDIVEIDAASNNGVDEIRELRDKVRYGPAMVKYRVYIIDEVHMLSAGAFNALLKTLEEPPAHAVFILATTEMHRLPATILSRCQRFDFRQIDEGTMVRQMREILLDIGRTADDDALLQIARAAEGGMRDALSILDQCLMMADHLGLGAVYETIGHVGGERVQAFVDAFLAADAPAVLGVVDEVAKSGASLEVFVRECMTALRDRLIAQDAGDIRARCTFAIEVLAQLQGQMRYAPRPRVLLDAAAVRLCLPQSETTPAALLARIEMLEAKLALAERRKDVAPPPADARMGGTRADEDVAPPPIGYETDDVPPWDDAPPSIGHETDDVPPWDDAPPPPPKAPARVKRDERRAEEPPPAPVAAPAALEGDVKAIFLAGMGRVSAGVSQSIRLCTSIVRRENTVYIAFDPKDAIFVEALRQHQQDLERIAAEIYGGGVGVRVVTDDDIPSPALDERDVAKKAEEIFGVRVEIEHE